MPGLFIALEGTEGSGKSTIAARLGSELRAEGREVVVTREPGGTPVGDQIRGLLLGPASGTMRPETEALLFAASRAQHIGDVIRPALERGAIVVCDRFVDSSLAYQWGGRGLDRDGLSAVQRLATNGIEPDLKLLLDLPVSMGLKRRLADDSTTNRLDQEAVQFHERVRRAYHQLVADEPRRWCVVDASRPEAEVWSDVWRAVVIASASGAESPGDDRGLTGGLGS